MPDPDIDALDAIAIAEDAHVEACTGDQVRAALAPFVPYLREIHPEGARKLLTGLGATGDRWIDVFCAPTRMDWRGKRYRSDVSDAIIPLIDSLDALQGKTAEAYLAAIGADPFAEPIAHDEPRLRRPAPTTFLGRGIFDPMPPSETTPETTP